MKNEKHFLDSVKWGLFSVVNYQGVEVWKLKKGYKVLGRVVNSVGEVDEVLGEARKAVEMGKNRANDVLGGQ